MHLGRVRQWGRAEDLLKQKAVTDTEDAKPDHDDDAGGSNPWVASSGNSRLGELVLSWLRADLRDRGPRSGAADWGSEGRTYGFGSDVS
jgi:hypothetical protein